MAASINNVPAINAIRGGFGFASTGLHYGAMNGHRVTVEFLRQRGADLNVRDAKFDATAAGWAAHGGQTENGHGSRGFVEVVNGPPWCGDWPA